jgi:hypothetical protein
VLGGREQFTPDVEHGLPSNLASQWLTIPWIQSTEHAAKPDEHVSCSNRTRTMAEGMNCGMHDAYLFFWRPPALQSMQARMLCAAVECYPENVPIFGG